MSVKGNLAVFEGSNISETRMAMPTKIGFHAFDIKLYLHEFSKREIWPFSKVAISPKPEKYIHQNWFACI